MKNSIDKKRYKSRLSTAACLFLIGILMSCGKYLDVTPENVGTIDYAFRNRNEAENYLFTCYNTLQSLNASIDDPGFITSGELYNQSWAPNISGTNFTIISGIQNTNSPILNYWSGTNGGKSIFQGIRRCNIFLENLDKPIDLTPSEKDRWRAEVNFLKAYYHFWMLKMYGPIPILDKADDISAPIEELRDERQPVDSVFNYVVRLMDDAIQDLPEAIFNPTQEAGRITKTIAMSVKAEVLTTQASPLFNGNADYVDYTNKDGRKLFSTSSDNLKWQKAAQACKAAIDQAESVNSSLYQFIIPPAIPRLNDSLKLLLSVQGAVTEKWDMNRELIWALNGTFGLQPNMTPFLTTGMSPDAVPGNISVPLAVAELFYSNNGVPINEDMTWDYGNRFAVQTADAKDRFYLKENYTSIKFNFKREPRYYADLAFDGGMWFGAGILNYNTMRFVEGKKGGVSGVKEYGRANVTGYWPKKLVHYLTQPNGSNLQQTAFRLPRMRLADLYILYAECLNEATGPSGEVYSYIDKVRQRAGLQGVVLSWSTYSNKPDKPLTKEGLREIIHRERRIELCFEGKIGWDLRRWKEYVTEVSKPIQGWNVMQEDVKGYYTLQTYMIPVINLKDYFFPVSGDALLNNNNLVQSPFWQ